MRPSLTPRRLLAGIVLACCPLGYLAALALALLLVVGESFGRTGTGGIYIAASFLLAAATVLIGALLAAKVFRIATPWWSLISATGATGILIMIRIAL